LPSLKRPCSQIPFFQAAMNLAQVKVCAAVVRSQLDSLLVALFCQVELAFPFELEPGEKVGVCVIR
jgi:hypothetical protein